MLWYVKGGAAATANKYSTFFMATNVVYNEARETRWGGAGPRLEDRARWPRERHQLRLRLQPGFKAYGRSWRLARIAQSDFSATETGVFAAKLNAECSGFVACTRLVAGGLTAARNHATAMASFYATS